MRRCTFIQAVQVTHLVLGKLKVKHLGIRLYPRSRLRLRDDNEALNFIGRPLSSHARAEGEDVQVTYLLNRVTDQNLSWSFSILLSKANDGRVPKTFPSYQRSPSLP